MNTRLFYALWILAIGYFLYRTIFKKRKVILKDPVEDVINSDKYKVKGQFD